ncbi:MAG: aldo/keto reductase [Acetobacteraceae bacterium]
MKTRDGARVAPLGMSTWSLGDSRVTYKEEITCLHEGLDAGLTMIDTAEIYGNWRSETLIGDVMAERRQDAFLVSKIMPNHATFEETQRHCRVSLERLKTDYLDLYLLHWRGHIPLHETIEAMEKLKSDGLIRHWGVSNFDVEDMEEVVALTPDCACNQVLYNVRNRGTEFELLSKLEAHRIKAVACPPWA